MLEIRNMPEENARQKRERLRVEKQDQRDAVKAAEKEKTRLEKLFADVPNAVQRCKLALSIPSDAYPELNDASVEKVIAYFGVSRSMYFAVKKDMQAAVDVHYSAEKLARVVSRAHSVIGQESQQSLSDWDRGDEEAVRKRIKLNVLDDMRENPTGRPKMFWKETIDAAVLEFLSRVVSIKRGMANDALREMLVRLRQTIQAPPGVRLEEPSQTCIDDAVKEMNIGAGVAGGAATPDRAAALEDYRNAISCAALWTFLSKLGISPALLYNLDEVGIYLDERNNKVRILRFPEGMVEEAANRHLSPAEQRKKTHPRMMYMECMTAAEGRLVATVVRVVESTIPVGEIVLKHVERDVYIAYVNKNYDKAKFHKRMMTTVWLPRIRKEQLEETVRCRPAESALNVEARDDSQEFSQGTGSAEFKLLPGEKVLRALLSFDGAYEHIEAIMTGGICDYCSRHNIGLFKWAAGCSLVQQPNDVSKCHKLLHAYFRSSKFKFNVDVTRKDLRSGYGKAMKVLDLYKADTKTKTCFLRFFYHLPQVLHQSFSPRDISDGYKICGIEPFSVDAIMNGWNPGGKKASSSWAKLALEEQNYVKIAIEKLSLVAAVRGTVTDEDVDSCVVDDEIGLTLETVLADARTPEYLKAQIKPGKGINRRRCILLTNKKWLEQERSDRAQLLQNTSAPRQIYGKDFDPAKCQCRCASLKLDYHSKSPLHNEHVGACVTRLRAAEVLDPEQDDAVKLAQAWIILHPDADADRAVPMVVEGVEVVVELHDVIGMVLGNEHLHDDDALPEDVGAADDDDEDSANDDEYDDGLNDGDFM